jgi:hypothetical protein
MSYNNFTEFPYLETGGAGHGTLFVKRYGIDNKDGTLQFPAFINSFQESFNSSWERETVFGRSDPMQFYGGTQRVINLSFKLVAASAEVARLQLAQLDIMMQFLYPKYANRAYSSAPLIGLIYENLIREGNDYLIGTIGSFSFTPDFEEGVFTPRDLEGASIADIDAMEVYPQVIEVSFDFYPIHRKTLGWSSPFRGDDFHPINITNKEMNTLVKSNSAKVPLVDDPEVELDKLDSETQEELTKQKKKNTPGSPEQTIGSSAGFNMLETLKNHEKKLEALIKLESSGTGFSKGKDSLINKYKADLNATKQKILSLEGL